MLICNINNFLNNLVNLLNLLDFFVYNYESSGDLMNETYLKEIIYKMLDLKLTEIRKEYNKFAFSDLISYLRDVIFKNNKIVDLNDLSFFIMNIKVNKVFEHINLNAMLDKTSTIENDLKSILER